MDRQQLLEKKRQRLLELKSRRSAVPGLDFAARDIPVDTPSPPPKVDFSVQVDLPQTTVSSAPTPRLHTPQTHDTHKIHKAIQTDPVSEEVFRNMEIPVRSTEDIASTDVAATEKVVSLSSPEQTPKEQVIHQALEKQLSELGYSDIRLGIKHSSSSISDSRVPFDVTINISKFLDRPIACVATNVQHPNLLLVAYGKTREKTRKAQRSSNESLQWSSGLAVLFNRTTNYATPEFFLQCTSPISKIAFDNSDPFHIVAGLDSGRVVMWDLTAVAPTQVAVLPTLQTSYISSLTEKSSLNFVHHVSPIIFMKQLNIESLQDSAIMTICEDGVINVWSPNFFALPKFSSIQLSPRDRNMLLISYALLTSHKPFVSQDQLHDAPEYRFLDSVIMASTNGVIYRLANQKEKNYISSELKDHIEGAIHSSAVTSLVELSNSLILSAHSDFFLRVWNSATNKLLLAIPTATLISTVLGRPGHPNQVITAGTLRVPESGFYVELWDFDVNIKGPVFNIPTKKKSSGIVSFSADGSELVLGYDDGELDVWKIDDSILSKCIATSYSEPEGLESLASLNDASHV